VRRPAGARADTTKDTKDTKDTKKTINAESAESAERFGGRPAQRAGYVPESHEGVNHSGRCVGSRLRAIRERLVTLRRPPNRTDCFKAFNLCELGGLCVRFS
jgi:hypothetical protein